MFEVKNAQIVGKTLSHLFSTGWSSPEIAKSSQESLSKKGVWFGNVEYRLKANGHTFLALTSITVFNDASGKRRGSIYSINSIEQAPSVGGNDLLNLASDLDIGQQELANIIDSEALQSMLADLYAVTKIGFAVVDFKGNVIASAGRQDICVNFHRTNPQTLWNCLESDLVLTQGVARGEFRAYKCKNNMWDIVTPIVIGGHHLGNLFSGQFFFDDEAVDKNVFVAQAEKYGFNKDAYLAALDRVPRWNRAVVQNLMQFYAKLFEMISKLSYSNLKLSKALSHQKLIERKLRENQQDLNHAQKVAKTGSWRLNVQKNELCWSDQTYRMFGLKKALR